METITNIISWAVFGLIVGAIARALYPGRQPMSLLMTMVLGVIGSLVGGAISWVLHGAPDGMLFQGSGWILSILGALIVVGAGLYFSNRGQGRMTTGG